MAAGAASPLFADRIWPRTGENRLLRFVALAVLGTVLLTLSAKVKVPFYPVEMTMQTCLVLLIGAAYGPRLAVATVLLYLAQGAAGLPVFTGTPERGLGLAYMTGPTGGFLLGFVASAALAGVLAERGWLRSLPSALVGLLAADALVFIFGLAWLSTLIGWDRALAGGLYPFLLSEAVKVGLAALLVVAGGSLFGDSKARAR